MEILNEEVMVSCNFNCPSPDIVFVILSLSREGWRFAEQIRPDFDNAHNDIILQGR
jgi:hypothetical protein